MQVKVGCEMVYQTTLETPLALLVRPRPLYKHTLLQETRRVSPEVPVHEFVDGFGNHL